MKKADEPKKEATARDKSEPQLVTKAPAAAPAKTTSKPASEATTKKKVKNQRRSQEHDGIHNTHNSTGSWFDRLLFFQGGADPDNSAGDCERQATGSCRIDSEL